MTMNKQNTKDISKRTLTVSPQTTILSRKQLELIEQIQKEIENTPGDQYAIKQSLYSLFNNAFSFDTHKIILGQDKEVKIYLEVKRILRECLLENINVSEYYSQIQSDKREQPTEYIDTSKTIKYDSNAKYRKSKRDRLVQYRSLVHVDDYYYSPKKRPSAVYRIKRISNDKDGEKTRVYVTRKIPNLVYNQAEVLKAIPLLIIQGNELTDAQKSAFIKIMSILAMVFMLLKLATVELSGDDMSVILFLCNKEAFTKNSAIKMNDVPYDTKVIKHLIELRVLGRTGKDHKIYLAEEVNLSQ